jgi:exonuclease V gamma subunit
VILSKITTPPEKPEFPVHKVPLLEYEALEQSGENHSTAPLPQLQLTLRKQSKGQRIAERSRLNTIPLVNPVSSDSSPQKVNVKELAQYVKYPLEYYLHTRLRVTAPGEEGDSANKIWEPLQSDPLQKWNLRDQILKSSLQKFITQGHFPEELPQDVVRNILREEIQAGNSPEGAFLERWVQELHGLCADYYEMLRDEFSELDCAQISVDVDLNNFATSETRRECSGTIPLLYTDGNTNTILWTTASTFKKSSTEKIIEPLLLGLYASVLCPDKKWTLKIIHKDGSHHFELNSENSNLKAGKSDTLDNLISYFQEDTTFADIPFAALQSILSSPEKASISFDAITNWIQSEKDNMFGTLNAKKSVDLSARKILSQDELNRYLDIIFHPIKALIGKEVK